MNSVNTFWKADYARIERRLCGLCEMGDEPKRRVSIPVMESVQVRFPRSKKKRIRKKWAKQEKNRQPNLRYLVMGADLFDKIQGPFRKLPVGRLEVVHGEQSKSSR